LLTQIILIGYRATGKTSVGKLLAARLGCPFLDLDQELAKRQGQSIAELVATRGWPYFRGLEREMLVELIAPHDRVISTGGGAILQQDIWPRLQATSFIVWLMADRETICRRLMGDAQTMTQRPTLTGSDTYAEIAAVLQEREPLYRAGCHFAVDTTTLGLEEIVGRILGARASRPLLGTDDEKAGGTPALP
jgi:shikimate kinase